MTAADRERILDRFARSLPNGGEERIVSLSRADVEVLRKLVKHACEKVEHTCGHTVYYEMSADDLPADALASEPCHFCMPEFSNAS